MKGQPLMYTMLWTENGADKWDRFSSAKEVREKLTEIENNEEASPLGDVWIFPPKADDIAVTGEDF